MQCPAPSIGSQGFGQGRIAAALRPAQATGSSLIIQRITAKPGAKMVLS